MNNSAAVKKYREKIVLTTFKNHFTNVISGTNFNTKYRYQIESYAVYLLLERSLILLERSSWYVCEGVSLFQTLAKSQLSRCLYEEWLSDVHNTLVQIAEMCSVLKPFLTANSSSIK